MDSSSRDDIRKLLKTFGIEADEQIVSYLARTEGDKPLRLRITLEDLTDYGTSPPAQELRFEMEGEVRRD